MLIIWVIFLFADFDKCEIAIYEEVTRMPPFQRKTLILVGASGVGRRSLKQKLLKDDPRRFGAVMPRKYYSMITNGYLVFYAT